MEISKSKSKAYQCYNGGSEIFYFPMELKSQTIKRELQGRTFVIDPWPAYASERLKTTSQIIIDSTGHLKRQDRVTSKLTEPFKPMLLLQLEEKIYKDTMKYKITSDPTSPIRLQMFREVYDLYIENCGHYKPILSQIKAQYDHYITFLHQKISDLLPLREMINSVSIDCDVRIKNIKVGENQDIKNLEADKMKDIKMIEKLKLETKEYKGMIVELERQLAKETQQHIIEMNGRKHAISAVNQLSDQVTDMNNLMRQQKDEPDEDPRKLRIALELCRKALSTAQRKVVEFKSHFEAMVPSTEMEEVERKLNLEREVNAKLNDDLMGMTNRYDLLQEHCAALNTYRDLFQVQCNYVLRVIGSKSEAAQKVEYIGLLLSKWRRIIAEKSIEDLTRMATEESQRYEAGGIPPISRGNRTKRSVS